MSHVIVERTVTSPLTGNEDCRELAELGTCFRIHDVRFVEFFVSEHRNRMICHFEAPDAESVRQALRGAGVAVDSIWTANVVRKQHQSIKSISCISSK